MGSRKRRSLIIGGGVAAVAGTTAIGAPPAEAATFNVTNLNDAGAGSLRQAIADANGTSGADTITFQSGLTGTITLVTQLRIRDSVDIQGPGAAVLAVSGNLLTRVFYLYNDGPQFDVTISGLTIRDGVTRNDLNNTQGGGILNIDENLTLDHVVLTNNEADNHDGSGYGGGLYSRGDSFEVTIVDSTVSGNTAYTRGGGVYVDQYIPVPFQPTSVGASTHNRPQALPTSPGDVSFLHSTVSGNDAGSGGGIYIGDLQSGNFIVSESTFSGNEATNPQLEGGGGILLADGSGDDVIDHSTVAGNTSAAGGGGLAILGATATLDHALFGDNTATGAGPDISKDVPSALTGSFTLVETSSGFTLGGANNILGSDPQLGALADNGGPTLTHLPALTSPAVNAGNPAYVADPGGDQRHSTRIVGTAVDIGAVETVGPPVNDAYSTPEDTPLVVPTLGVLANDPDGANTTSTLGNPTTHGTVVLNANGSFTYTPNLNYNGPDQFTYVQTTVLGVAQTAIVNITVTPVNDPPIAVNDSATAADNGVGVPVAVLTNDSDPDGDTITVVSVTQASKGTVTFTPTGVVYTPNRGTSGVDTFTYTISDGAATATATVTITVAPAPTTTTIPEPVILPATGRDSGPSTELALGLLGAGVVLTAASRRRLRFRRVRN